MRFICFIFYFMFLLNPLASAMGNLDLFKVAQEGNAKQIKELIDSGIDLSKKDANGRNALMHSVIFGNKETVLELLKEFKELETRKIFVFPILGCPVSMIAGILLKNNCLPHSNTGIGLFFMYFLPILYHLQA